MSKTFVKICGIRDIASANVCIESGVDAIGLVFYPNSPRVVTSDVGQAIVKALPIHVKSIALFVNAKVSDVFSVIDEVKPAILQFHGDEEADYCVQFGLPYWKAIRVNTSTDLLNLQHSFSTAARILLDADKSGAFGGTGETFDWTLIPQAMRPQIVLSGGLHTGNVASAIKAIKPWGVDVSSGVEESKGVKSALRIRQFMNEVSLADV